MLTVVPTIDVEGVHGQRPFEQLVLGEIGDSQTWGVYRQAEIFSRHGCSATFFVDVYEYTMWGVEPVREVCLRLLDVGQDVQLHTHPGWRDDPRDPDWLRKIRREKSYLGPDHDFMAKLSLEEQVDVLEHGAELLTTWTGQVPIAHRSGGYSIDGNTVAALSRVGIPVDSSMQFGHPHSRETWSRNAIVERHGVVELPVTVGLYTVSIPSPRGRIPLYRKLKKTDLDLYDFSDFTAYVEQALRNDVRFLNLFMHSYSFIDGSRNWTRIKPQPHDVWKLDALLEWLMSHPEVEVLSCKQFYDRYRKDPSQFLGSDFIPSIPLRWAKVAKYSWGKLERAATEMRRNLRTGGKGAIGDSL